LGWVSVAAILPGENRDKKGQWGSRDGVTTSRATEIEVGIPVVHNLDASRKRSPSLDVRMPLAAPGVAAGARCAQHAAGNLNNRHVEILCAASAHVNVSVSYQPLTPPTGLGLLACSRRAPFGRIAWGSVAPRKMACRLAREGKHSQWFKAINSRTGEGQPSRCPFLIPMLNEVSSQMSTRKAKCVLVFMGQVRQSGGTSGQAN
jgi:hypothetical protein